MMFVFNEKGVLLPYMSSTANAVAKQLMQFVRENETIYIKETEVDKWKIASTASGILMRMEVKMMDVPQRVRIAAFNAKYDA